MIKKRTYQVRDVAKLSGVSVRTLHYYDEIGLLAPSGRTTAGYRLYSDKDLLRLQQILINRTLGLSLNEIKRSLDEPDFDLPHQLRRQRSVLVDRLTETHKMIAAIDSTLNQLSKPKDTPMDLKTIFDGFDPADFEAEARQQWGETEAYRQSARRSAQYTEEEWQALKEEQDAIWKAAAETMRAGEPADSDPALAIAERHRQYICRWFYDLSPDKHARLAELWETDTRFAETINRHGDGLTVWLAAAVRAAADRSS